MHRGRLKRVCEKREERPGQPRDGVKAGGGRSNGRIGEGLGKGGGMAIDESVIATGFKETGAKGVDRRTYVFVGVG
ncbi:hypothetical protein A6V37_37890 [Paraburkholderia ginsengiterrae]|uniref:Transketolase N-terminal domain-containing protein n=1 Tax=Paraburkholderia ginsengiterrae TaxID=1462993 RepID=A0A1A9NE00_9BURK|nr:hypothetical protein A6V37_37890 [Paraburkholderia ginsengiterrae]